MHIILVVQLVVFVPVLLCRRFLGRHGLGRTELGGLPDPARVARRTGWVGAGGAGSSALADKAAHEVGKVVGEERPDGGDACQGDG